MELTEANPLTAAAGRNESLHRAFQILRLLSKNDSGASVAALSAESGLPRTTVSRLLASLFDVGAVARPGTDRLWVLGPAISELSGSVQHDVALQIVGLSVLESFTAEFDETCMMAVPVAESMATVTEEVKGTHLLGISGTWKGQTVSSLDSGFVRMLLAELPSQKTKTILDKQFDGSAQELRELTESIDGIRLNDYSVVVDTLEAGLSGIGVPVRKSGRLVAMLATYLPTSRFTEDFRIGALSALRQGAETIASR
ncbi:IclR family transcriptional regulator [Glutamicibacter sp. NPDC087344]|uniref:IclR family transcriptional regulator n=1 Tax=Glutamicibacter sp. NPDC087344 TaxID=3363994 RepID=UPI00382CFDE4